MCQNCGVERFCLRVPILSNSLLPPEKGFDDPGLQSRKRRQAENENSDNTQKRRRQFAQSSEKYETTQCGCVGTACLPFEQLPSSASTGTARNPITSSSPSTPTPWKRKAKSLDWPRSLKRTRVSSEPVHAPPAIVQWLAQLPGNNDFDALGHPQQPIDMSQPPSKRSHSASTIGGLLSQSGDGSDTVVSKDRKYSVYKNATYSVVLETKGSYMRPSKLGMCVEDRDLCDKLLNTTQPYPDDILFDDKYFNTFYTNLFGRSKARIYADLHPRIMPSVENLYIYGRKEFEGFIEGHNDPWTKCIPFYGPQPQPDHTYGFKWSNFSEQQRRKLNIEPTTKSYYTAREDIYFPFLTGEVKCGKQALELADRLNTHSITIVQRGLVDLYRQLGRAHKLHRKVLGFSLSHNDRGVRLYAHYPEIDGDIVTYWRETLREFSIGDGRGKEKWKCYQFTLNVCQIFALPFLEQLKSLIDELPDPITRSFGLSTAMTEFSVQDDASATESQDEGLARAPTNRGMDAELRSVIQGLQRQLEQQRTDTMAQLEQQRKELEQQHKESEQQRKESEQQRKESEQKQKDLMELLRQALQNK